MPIQSDIIDPFPGGIAILEFLLIDLLLLASGIFLVKRRKFIFCESNDVLSADCGQNIRGLLAILIVLHHLSLTIRYTVLFKIFAIIGAPCVAVFFFYSGYGLMTSYLSRNDYLKHFISRRLLKILIPYLFSMLITWLGYLLTKYKYTPREVFNSLLDGDPFVRYSWYVLAILVFYLIFYLCGRLLKTPKLVLAGVLAGTVAYCIVVTHCFSWGNWTVGSCFTFSFGIASAIYRKQIKHLLEPQRKHMVILLSLLSVCGALIVGGAFLNDWYSVDDMIRYPEIGDTVMKQPLSVLAMNVICCLSVLIIFYIFRKIKWNNRIFQFLGKISFEIYLYHGLVMYLFRNPACYCKVDILYMAFTLSVSIFLAFVMHKAREAVYSGALKMVLCTSGTKKKVKSV